MEKNNGNEDLIKDIEMINKINKYMNSKNLTLQFNGYDYIKAKKIFHISDINFILTKKGIKRKINFIIHSKNKLNLKYNLDNNKYFLLLIYNYIYIYKEILPCVKLFFKNNLISFHTVYLFLDFFLEINEENEKKILLYIMNINSVIANLKKIFKIAKISDIDNKNIINNDIYNLLQKIFSKNNMQKISNIIYCKNLMNYGKILSLLKICFNYYNNDILNDYNKKFIIDNLKNLCFYNLNISHLNYLFKTSKKYLKHNFNNKIQKSEKNYYSFYNGILIFLEEIMNNKYPYLIDKYFIFNSSENKKGILTTSEININNDGIHNELNLSLIFSFRPIKFGEKNKEKIIFSVNDDKTKNFIIRFILNENNLYLITFSNNKQKEHPVYKNIQYDIDNFCFVYFDNNENLFHFYINEDIKNSKIIKQKLPIKDIKQIYFEVGNNFDDSNNQFEKFNGLIGPILAYNSKIVNPLDIYLKLNKIKKYYLIEDIIINSSINNENIYFSYYDYFGIWNNKNELIKIISDLKKVLNNLIYYINPEVISNNLNFHTEDSFRDYQIYNNPLIINNHHVSNKYYGIHNDDEDDDNDEKNLNDFILIHIPFIENFISNNIFDYFVVNIELIYNKLLFFDETNIKENEFILL